MDMTRLPAVQVPRNNLFSFSKMCVSAVRLPVLCAIIALVLAVMIAGCRSEPVGPGPGQVGELYYDAIKAGDFYAAAELYVPGVPRGAVVDELEMTRERLGDLENYRRTDLVSYTASGGMRFTLRFMTRYSKGHATEGLMLFQSSADNIVRIEQHTIQ
jgi:hypothetical protein